MAWKRSRFKLPAFRVDPVVLLCAAGCAAVLSLTAIAAAFSPPNSADAMAYHMPRVVYWAEQASVRFFPTTYFNQTMLQPFAEYAMLHTYLLSGGDRFINFVQWFASAASIIAVASIAMLFGASARGQAVAAVVCATIPAGILASSGAKNDYWMAMWLVAAVYFALRFTREFQSADALLCGFAVGFALLTKATAYLYAPWLLAAILVPALIRKRTPAGALVIMACALAINTPHYVRNYHLSGSIMGFDSAQADGFFRWRNETFGWKQTASNILRNLSEQLGARSPRWNQGVYNFAAAAHKWIGIRMDDPATTWRWSAFEPPKNANHEANAPSRWHLLLFVVMACLVAWKGNREQTLYALALVCGFVALCAFMKWQPFLARLFLPLFVLSAPLAGAIRGRALQILLCLFLLNSARPALLENWVRPLKGPRSVLHVPRDVQYFADMTEWNNQPTYWKTLDVLASTNCGVIGLDISHYPLEYPIQAILRERKPNVVFLHTGVQNFSERYPPSVGAAPCAVVCLECLGDEKRLATYSSFARRIDIDKFVVFLEPDP
ncbi:MAG: ArnT family glycosyltransferase [Bryobacteraceae bacterium]